MFATLRSVSFILLISLMILTDVFADDLMLLRKQATDGEAASQYLLGVKYDTGQGVSRDYHEALTWYRKSAEQGFAAARNNLGVLYQLGQGVPLDFKEALKWYRLAAQQGFALAQYNLGLMYAEGQGVKQDYVEARLWYQQAAEQGNAAARKKLGALAIVGKEENSQDRDSLPSVRQSAAGGSEKPATVAGPVAKTVPPVSKETPTPARQFVAAVNKKSVDSPPVIPAAPQTVREPLTVTQLSVPSKPAPAAPEVKNVSPPAAESSPSKQASSGAQEIPVVTREKSLIDQEVRQSAERGSAEAQNKLGILYLNGQGVAKDYREALHWFLLAVNQGFAPAQNELGYMYFTGEGVTTNYAEAFVWFRLAAEQGYALAQNNLGVMYQQGLGGLSQDYHKAFTWYRLAANQGLRGAQRNLGAMYFNGQGVEKNNHESLKLLRMAAAQGDPAAAEIIKTVVRSMPADQGMEAQRRTETTIPLN
jgi:TPR repeat protein